MTTSTPVLPSAATVLEHLVPAGGVVVGDDGSPASRAVVRWAADDAARRGAPLHVVRAWSITTAPTPRTWAPGYVPPFTDFEAAVREELERTRRPLVDGREGLDVRWHAVHGRPETVLSTASTGADLLVVGSRGRGELRELLLGSVASAVLHSASCPVVVVRGRAA
ncbi:Nucleotide-binding universal stress protein, UspA family [Geodermatophilus pulveris]|uniref:Nucleotide-binding universal stress protein, UspA family n=1 Tax=Geodermatophilus pulveris TaxID=1564159 RepID=A0A239D6C4_9ACTN|nr:universal stress protein [Geodermatophilus pulveris]SNS27404.1 Nucleotide-binding universal stress protein, UspA family [Geodermatophilus pulveris]